MKKLYINTILNNKIQNVLVEEDIITYIGNEFKSADKIIDAKHSYIMPGIIDPHTHIRDMGQADKEDWLSASKAAMKGGVTMLFDMPNTKPPTVDLNTLNQKRKAAKKSLVKYRFNVAATSVNYDKVVEILQSKPDDVAALKMFFAGSNSNEFVNDLEVIKRYFELSLKFDIPVIIHTEWQDCVAKYSADFSNPTIFDHNLMRHRECAVKGTEIALKLAGEIGNKIVNAHTSVAEELDLIRQYKKKVNVFCEVTPHHLLINEDILEKVGNFGKVNPPLRTSKDNEALWEGINDGTVDFIGTDHAPHKISEKLLAFDKAPSGFPGLETNLRLMLNEVNKGNLSLKRLIELTSTNVARVFDLQAYGKIEKGYYADFIFINLDKKWEIKAADFESKAKYTPFEGFTGKGDLIMIN